MITIMVEDEIILKKGEPIEFRPVKIAGRVLPLTAPKKAPWDGNYILGRYLKNDELGVFFQASRESRVEKLIYNTSGEWEKDILEEKYVLSDENWTCT